jgi:hypothetical protein
MNTFATQGETGPQNVVSYLGRSKPPYICLLLVTQALLLEAGADASSQEHLVYRLV